MDFTERFAKIFQCFNESVFDNPSAFRGERLLRELEKPADEIDENYCLELIAKGVSLADKKIDSSASLKFEMAMRDLYKNTTSIPDPTCLFLAAEKGKIATVKALHENKIIHVAHYRQADGKTCEAFAAEKGHAAIVHYIASTLDKEGYNHTLKKADMNYIPALEA